MTISAGDRKSVRQAEKLARKTEAARQAVVRNIMSTIEGREWMWNLLSGCSVFSSTYVIGAADATAFNEGSRAVGLRLLADIMTACPDAYIEAQREANVRHALDERRRSPEPDGGDSGSDDAPDAADSTGEGGDTPGSADS